MAFRYFLFYLSGIISYLIYRCDFIIGYDYVSACYPPSPHHGDAVVKRGEQRLPQSPERRLLLNVADVAVGDDDGLQDEVLLALDPLPLQSLRRQHALQ